MQRIITLLLTATLLASCNGPWNTSVDDVEIPLNVRVGALLVAGGPFDTIWLDRTQKFGYMYDSSKAFIVPESSTVLVRDLGTDRTYAYRMADGNRRAWIPVDTSARVAWGTRFRLEANLLWNASRDFPDGTEWRRSTLTAETYTPASYDIADTIAVPLEAKVEWLADGVDDGEKALIAGKADSLARTLRDVPVFPEIDAEDLRKVAAGQPVWKLALASDSLWSIGGMDRVTDEVGNEMYRAYRQYGLRQRVDKSRFGGMLCIQTYDTKGEFILGPLSRVALDAMGRDTPDSANIYQPGSTRVLLLYGREESRQAFYPDTMLFNAGFLNYTGRTALRFYSLDSLYIEYYRTNGEEIKPSAFSNVRGGEGYFSAAGADSLVLEIRRPKNVQGYAVDSLRKVWCETGRDKALGDGETWSPGDICRGIDSTTYTRRDKKKGMGGNR